MFNHTCQNLEATTMSSVGEWINKLWNTQTLGHYSVLEKHVTRKRRQSKKAIYCMTSICDIVEQAKVETSEKDQWLLGLEGREV